MLDCSTSKEPLRRKFRDLLGRRSRIKQCESECKERTINLTLHRSTRLSSIKSGNQCIIEKEVMIDFKADKRLIEREGIEPIRENRGDMKRKNLLYTS